MGNVHRRHPQDDGARYPALRQTGSTSGLRPQRGPRAGRDRSDGLGAFPASPAVPHAMKTSVATATSTALLIANRATRAEHAEFEALLQGLGYQTLVVDAAEQMTTVRGPVGLCLLDLRENGDALKNARAFRVQYPQSVIIGVADPARPSAAADAIRAGVFDVLPRPPSARDLEALLANAREQTALATAQAERAAPEPMAYGLVGSSPAMRLALDLVQRAPHGRCRPLIRG